MAYDILLILLGWAIPAGLTWLVTQIPGVRGWLSANPIMAAMAFNCLISLLLSATAVFVYDRFFLPANIVVFAQEGKPCPSGYTNESTILLGRWNSAPDWFQVSKDTHIPYPGLGIPKGKDEPDWLLDHMTLCMRR